MELTHGLTIAIPRGAFAPKDKKVLDFQVCFSAPRLNGFYSFPRIETILTFIYWVNESKYLEINNTNCLNKINSYATIVLPSIRCCTYHWFLLIERSQSGLRNESVRFHLDFIHRQKLLWDKIVNGIKKEIHVWSITCICWHPSTDLTIYIWNFIGRHTLRIFSKLA